MMRTLTCSVVLLPAYLFAQSLVSTTPQQRTALLEEFTAINCGNCPAAHGVANTLAGAYPDDLVIVGVHGGGLAVPSGTQVDLRTTDGAALWTQLGVSFQPQGTVNRQVVQQANGWSNAIATVLAQTSPVNLGMATTFDPDTRELTVDVELYYTADGTGDADRISVLLTQDHIVGYQQDYVNGAHPAYDHRHVLRDHITPLIGDEVVTTTSGTLVQRTYTFTVPEAWVVDDLDAVAFVAEQGGPVHQVRHLEATGGATTGIPHSERMYGTGSAFPVPANDLVTIPLDPAVMMDGTFVLRDVAGRVVLQQRMPQGATQLVLPVGGVEAGVYLYGVEGFPARVLTVAR